MTTEHAVNHRVLDSLVLAAIAANTGVVIAGVWDTEHEHVMEMAHNVLLGFFSVEVAIRMAVAGRAAWRDHWLAFDTVVIALSLMPFLGEATSLLRIARAARLVHLVKHISHLRMVRFIVGFQRRCYHCDENARWWDWRWGGGHVVGTCCAWWFEQDEAMR
jgi:hypothetical protein